MTTFFSVIALLSSLGLILSVALQESSEGAAGMASSEPLWGQSKGTSKQDMLKRATIISAVVFIISHLILTILG